MNFLFFLFIAVFVVALYASLQIFDKLKTEIANIKSKEEALIEEIGGEPSDFHRFVVILLVCFAQRQRLDVGCITFIYNYIKQAAPEEMVDTCILHMANATSVVVNDDLYCIVDLNESLRKNQLIFDEKNLKRLSDEDVEICQYSDEKDFVDFVQSSLKNFSETGRKYMAYLVCRMTCAASHNNPDFLNMKELLTDFFALGTGDVDELLTCCSENKLPLWYGKHIQETNKNYPAYDKFTDILRAEYPSLPPYDWKLVAVKHANRLGFALYMVLSLFIIFGIYVFKGLSSLLIAAIPLLILAPSIALSTILYRWLSPEVLLLEDNRFKWKPTSLHKFFIFYTFALYLLVMLNYVMGLFCGK